MNPYYQQAAFLKSAAKLAQAPEDTGFEVAFAGRSNAGKSSALNEICQQKSLARTSKTPGRTQLLNFFRLDDDRRLVDLPGYGYAKVSEKIKAQWQGTLADYIELRQCLCGMILIMDIRNPYTDYDQQMIEWNRHAGLPTHILLTKADKLGRGAAMNVLLGLRKQLAVKQGITVQLFSALKHQGTEEVHQVLDAWFGLTTEAEKKEGSIT